MILGGGVVGVEMAQAYELARLAGDPDRGGDRLIAREEPFASDDVRRRCESGVDVQLGVKASAVRAEDGRGRGRARAGGRCAASELLVAIGRRPNTDDIGLETVGLEPGKPIEVDDRMRANEWLYAIGDVNGRALLTHMGKYQARGAADVILGEDRACPRTASARRA